MKTGRGDDYGYGWWIMAGDAVSSYAAAGRGGQRIAVFPRLDTVVVTTGAGFEPSTVLDLVGKALRDPEKPLPADPDGEARLSAALAEIARPPAPRSTGPLPATAQEVSGKVYAFEPNPLDLATMRVDFDGTAAATLALEFFHQPPRTGKVGLDGVYRFSPGENGLPVGIRGAWGDEGTFLVEYDTVASIDAFDLRIRFEGDRVTMDAKDRTYQSGVRLAGRAERTGN
jgi:hypothetical protein